MGIPFKPSEMSMSKPNADNSNHSEKSSLEKCDSEKTETADTRKSIEPAEFDFKNVEISTVEVITLPPEKIKPQALKHECSVMELLRQLIGATPGLIVLLITGMQLCWAVTEFDMAVYNKMYSDSIYKIGMIIACSFYIGAIFGQPVGAVLVIHMKKKFIYMFCAFLLIVSGEFLKNCYDVPYHIIGRTLLGFVHSIAHLTVITYASEATTKIIRTKLLSAVAFVNILSVLVGAGLALANTIFMDSDVKKSGNGTITIEFWDYVVDDLDIVSISGMVIMIIAIIALLLTPFITRESIPFLVRDNNNTAAYNEFVSIVKTNEKDSEAAYKFENWRNLILMHPGHTMKIFHKENFKPLMLLWHTRILSLLFNSIFVSVMFTRLLLFDEQTNIKFFYNETMPSYDLDSLKYSLDLLFAFKSIGFICGMILLLFGLKWKVDRFCFKLSFVWGLSGFVVYVVYSSLDVIKSKPPYVVMAIFVYSIMVIYMVVPFKFDVLQYVQIAKIYDEANQNYKIWSLAFIGSVEHFLHILLLMNVFLFPSLGALLTEFGIFSISLWLLKNIPNDRAVYPSLKNAFRKATNLTFLK